MRLFPGPVPQCPNCEVEMDLIEHTDNILWTTQVFKCKNPRCPSVEGAKDE